VPVLYVFDLTDEQKRAYRILDNKLQNDSAWDFENLELELGWLEDHDVDLEVWGLSDLKFDSSSIEPVSEDEQGHLDEIKPDWVKCPFCEHVFDGKQNKTKN
jgi:hypothetical protein